MDAERLELIDAEALLEADEEQLPYDTPAYVRSLAYLGRPEVVPGLPWPVIVRSIPNSDRRDAVGPWPYGSAPDADGAREALRALKAAGAVTFTAFLRPDETVDEAGLRRAGLTLAALKEHYLFTPGEPEPEQSKKTRYNLAAARRRWAVRPVELDAVWPRLARWHRELAERRAMSRFALVDDAHFEALRDVPGAAAVGAYDAEGLAAALVVAICRGSVHFHAVLGAERAYTQRAFYALYDDAVRRWGGDRLVCMGGAPGGPDGPGIVKFKRRFANTARPVTMLQAVLDEAACAELAARQGASGFFPPYRTAAD